MATSLHPPRGDNAHLWLAAGGLIVVLGCLLTLAFAILQDGSTSFQRSRLAAAAAAASPAPSPDDANVLLNNTPLAIAPTDALAINAARALDRTRLTAARPFVLTPALQGGEANAGAAIDCLTQAVYYEAASESDTGQRGVAQVVINRMRNPLFPHSVCGVVFQGSQLKTGCQFSFTCDGSLNRQPSIAGWARARRIAIAALAGTVERSVGLSTHYHADFVVPYWASSLDKVQTIGAHIFYTMRGARGRSASFTTPYDASAEVPPVMGPGGAAFDALIDAAGSEAVTGGDQPLRDRTTVLEDALGAPGAPALAPTAPVGALKADEAAGQLVIDRKPDVPTAPR